MEARVSASYNFYLIAVTETALMCCDYQVDIILPERMFPRYKQGQVLEIQKE